MKGFGIDFGTTNSLIAYFNPEIAQEPGAFMDAGRPHPSLVWYKPDSNQPVVGWEARKQMNAKIIDTASTGSEEATRA